MARKSEAVCGKKINNSKRSTRHSFAKSSDFHEKTNLSNGLQYNIHWHNYLYTHNKPNVWMVTVYNNRHIILFKLNIKLLIFDEVNGT